jgi:hypothetical protein
LQASPDFSLKMLCGSYSIVQRSVFVLFPSTWYAAVAHPHRNPSGKALPVSAALSSAGMEEPATAAWANGIFANLPTTAMVEAPRKSSRLEIPFPIFRHICNSSLGTSYLRDAFSAPSNFTR